MLNYFRKKIFDKRAKILNLKKSSKFKIQDKRAKILNLKKSSKFISSKFNYLDFEYKSYGKKNPNKFFFVIRRTPGAGFFSNLNFVLHNLYICEKLKMIPIIDMENYHTLYNCRIKINNSKNAWNYYYQSVSNDPRRPPGECALFPAGGGYQPAVRGAGDAVGREKIRRIRRRKDAR